MFVKSAMCAPITPALEGGRNRDKRISGACCLQADLQVQEKTLNQRIKVESDRTQHPVSSSFRKYGHRDLRHT